ncbi:phosphatases II, partial [Fragilariopsis cylindrus CCMP1102]
MSLVATFDVSSSSSSNIRHSIYIGGKVEAKDYDKLITRWKITHVLNITPTKQTNIEAGVPNYFESSSKCNLKYKRIPIYDSSISVSELSGKGYENDIIKFITNGLYYGNVFVHCSRGISRSTTGIILYLMSKRHMRYSNALALIRQRRPQVQPIPAFDMYLKK